MGLLDFFRFPLKNQSFKTKESTGRPQVDAFLKMPRPDDEASGLGTTRLDEPTLLESPDDDGPAANDQWLTIT